MSRFLFPRWSNALLPFILVVGATAPLYAVLIVAYGFSPKTLDGQYAPEQPVPYSHALHAGKLGLDCRYCHNTVESTSHAAVPPTVALRLAAVCALFLNRSMAFMPGAGRDAGADMLPITSPRYRPGWRRRP